jgi:CheY-like chemotaxis protein
MRRIPIRVVGFSDVERHAFNTLCRLSTDKGAGRDWGYEAWHEQQVKAFELTLVDGANLYASEVLDDLQTAPRRQGFIWVGAISPAKAWATFQRPLKWPDILASMDDYFLPANQREELDLDLVSTTIPGELDPLAPIGGPGSQAAPLSASDEPDSVLSSVWADTTTGRARKIVRALVVDPSKDGRMVARSMLSALGIGQVDESSSCTVALRMLQETKYDVLLVDLAANDADPWNLIAVGSSAKRRIVTGDTISLAARMAARVNGCHAMGKPLHSARLADVLKKKI